MTSSKNYFQIAGAYSKGRFSEILREPSGGRASHNQPLLERIEWVIAPTIGAIVPNWLIAVPRKPALSLRDWAKWYGISPKTIVDDLGVHIRTTSPDLMWFEHGPASFNSPVGCGTDYAHLHIIFRPNFSFDTFADQCVSSSKLTWKRTALEDTYEALPGTGSYLVAGSGQASIFASHVESTGSQFFRRVISVLSGRAGAWNYKYFPHAGNVAKTIKNFRHLERIAWCGAG